MNARWRPIASFIALTFTLAPLQVPFAQRADAQDRKLVIKTLDADASGDEAAGVRATIMFRSLALAEERPFGDIGESGVYEAAPFACEAGMSFRAEPKAKMIYIDPGETKPCSYEEIVFTFSRNAYAQRIQNLLGQDYGAYGNTQPRVAALGAELVAAVEAGAYGDVPVLATELKAQFEAVGYADLANDAAIVAYQSANVALGINEPLFFDVRQEEYVLATDTVAQIKKIQEANDFVATGKIDWKTMRYMSDEFGTGLSNRIYERVH